MTINEINPLDVILFEGEEYPLYSYDSYYQFKRNHKEGEFRKVYNKPRNLKPSQITFKENGIIKNLWDLPAFQAKYDYISNIENQQLTDFISHFNLESKEEIHRYLNR